MPPSSPIDVRRRLAIALLLASAVAAAVLLVPFGEPAGPPWRDEVAAERRTVDDLAGRVTAAEARAALAVIDPKSQLGPYLTISGEEAWVRLRDGGPPERLPLAPATVERARPATLSGMRILLDPGHFGGAWSEVESRHVAVSGGEPIKEGDLTWAVARLLEARLAGAGAEVVLTRGPPPTRPFPHRLHPAFDAELEGAILLSERMARPPWSSWRRLYPSLYGRLMLERAARELIEEVGTFRLYNGFDLRRRSALGAGFDLTLSIHFNTTGPRRDNWVMAFVFGNVMNGEAFTASQRYWSLRRVFDGHWFEQLALARGIVTAMKRHMDLPSLDPELLAAVEEPTKVVVDRERGVFARNLAILRRTPGRVVLIEGPCVDNAAEIVRLRDRSVVVDGRGYPRRVQQYADAVFEGVSAWLAE